MDALWTPGGPLLSSEEAYATEVLGDVPPLETDPWADEDAPPRPSRRLLAIGRECHECQHRILIADCFDSRARSFDAIELTVRGESRESDRWWLSRTRGMVHAGIAAPEPTRWVRLHHCRPRLVGPSVGQILAPGIPAPPASVAGPTAALAAPGQRFGYRWPGGPAHIIRPSGLALCPARVTRGETPREQERAALMPLCAICQHIHTVNPLT